jgi:hypothetical protein
MISMSGGSEKRMNEIYEVMNVLDKERLRISSLVYSFDQEKRLKIRQACENRSKLEAQLASLSEEAESRKEHLKQLEDSISFKRNQISKLLSNQGRGAEKLLSTLSQLKIECTAMELRIRLGLHELNLKSSKET